MQNKTLSKRSLSLVFFVVGIAVNQACKKRPIMLKTFRKRVFGLRPALAFDRQLKRSEQTKT